MWKIASGLSNVVVTSLSVAGIARLNDLLIVGRVWMLWRTPSEFRILYVWPTMIPITCGWYRQPFWSRTTGVLGTGQDFPGGNPFESQTMMFPIVLPDPRTSISFGT